MQVQYEGPKSTNPLAFKDYNADEVILGKASDNCPLTPRPTPVEPPHLLIGVSLPHTMLMSAYRP